MALSERFKLSIKWRIIGTIGVLFGISGVVGLLDDYAILKHPEYTFRLFPFLEHPAVNWAFIIIFVGCMFYGIRIRLQHLRELIRRQAKT